ncbi:hypothetical protein SAMN05421780_101397 [Flexibacter flexilis DSM 6793]|uniref:Uncharacterized protein n=1 Tax=Flexibacter flexilis DSM 6793 TaxID=927664 RepID=A0A1I1DQI9_9BACT|nr:hypothetical protein [Flexibacter flexilis]SFB77067.1 hypothetical protein SAMN05421780_101397 [Flexibacter flexilis DSM 6793]
MQNSEMLNEKIEAYLNDALSTTERKAFEQNMTTDSSLREEVSLQQDIIEGLKRERRAMLKARLSNVELPPLEAADIAATGALAYWAKWLGGAALLGGAIFAAYYWSNNEPETSGVANQQPATTIVVEKPTAAVAPVISQETAVTDADQVQHSNPQTPVAQSVNKQAIPSKNADKAKTTTSLSAKAGQVAAPVIDGNDSDNGFEKTDNGANTPTGNIANESVKASPRPEVIVEKSKDLSYQYFNNKLYLYGDFNSTPYELLELNSPSGRKMYIYFGNSFYALEESQNTTPLHAVKDADLINNLNVLRKKRAE